VDTQDTHKEEAWTDSVNRNNIRRLVCISAYPDRELYIDCCM
jgi:hypothetical protein